MFKQLSYCIPVSRVFLQTYQNKLFGIVTDRSCLWKLYLIFHDLYKISLISNVKRNSPKKKFISKNSNTPNINFIVIIFSFKKLRRYIKRSTTKGLSHSCWANRPTKIAQFDHSLNYIIKYIVKNDIFRLQISMDYLTLVHVVQSLEGIFQNNLSKILA